MLLEAVPIRVEQIAVHLLRPGDGKPLLRKRIVFVVELGHPEKGVPRVPRKRSVAGPEIAFGCGLERPQSRRDIDRFRNVGAGYLHRVG
jgi:hypothetical protein